jgi:hypothetical protein
VKRKGGKHRDAEETEKRKRLKVMEEMEKPKGLKLI